MIASELNILVKGYTDRLAVQLQAADRLKKLEYAGEALVRDARRQVFDALCLTGSETIGYAEHFVIEEEQVKELHARLTGKQFPLQGTFLHQPQFSLKANGGVYKKEQNFVVNTEGDQKYFVAPEDVELQLKKLLEALNTMENAHPLVVSAVFVCRFILIHPFPDLNGKTARTIGNWILFRNGYLSFNYEAASRESYIAALETSDRCGNELPFIQFLLDNWL